MSHIRPENNDLKKVGLKSTLPRLKILKFLEQAGERHMSAEEVYLSLLNSGEEVGLATVYRVLTQFEQAGLIVRHHFADDRAVFELADGHHHDHLVCLSCNKIIEFVDPVIEERQLSIAAQYEFKITEHCLYLYGTCKQCSSL
jgi:Fur family ferric uptake transcriptional regulator